MLALAGEGMVKHTSRLAVTLSAASQCPELACSNFLSYMGMWGTPVISALRKLRQEEHELEPAWAS
jgi:hypothetical protein